MAGAEFSLEQKRCERARQWSSLRLDGELSELEEALLDRHLEACSDCLSFDGRLRSAASSLRQTPPEPPLVSFRVPNRPRRRVAVPTGRRAAVVAIAAALALGSLVGSQLHRPASNTRTQEPQVSLLTRSDMNQLRQIPRGRQIVPPAPARTPGQPPEGLI
jgi:predicted anti-sigma-YlaC factor YlaD